MVIEDVVSAFEYGFGLFVVMMKGVEVVGLIAEVDVVVLVVEDVVGLFVVVMTLVEVNGLIVVVSVVVSVVEDAVGLSSFRVRNVMSLFKKPTHKIITLFFLIFCL